MLRIITMLVALICSTVLTAQNRDLRNLQQSKAIEFIQFIERADSLQAMQLLAKSYSPKKSKSLSPFFSLFYKDFKSLPGGTKRYVTLLPGSNNQFRFRYIGENGELLRVDISYNATDSNPRVVELGLVRRESLEKQRKTNRVAGYDFN